MGLTAACRHAASVSDSAAPWRRRPKTKQGLQRGNGDVAPGVSNVLTPKTGATAFVVGFPDVGGVGMYVCLPM